MLNLNDLHVFVQVVDHGGFAAASRALALPKQTLSKRVAELERRSGVRLIHRTSRSFAVTDLGRELYRHAAAMVIEAEAAENIVHGRLAEPSGTVRLTASVPMVQKYLSSLLPSLAIEYPKITVVLHVADRFVDIVQEGYDIALRTHTAPLPSSELIQRRVSADTFWLIASPAFLGAGESDDLDGLSGRDGIFSTQGETAYSITNANGDHRSIQLSPRYVANEGTAILAAATAGLGIAALPSSMCKELIKAGSLIRVAPSWSAGQITTTMILPSRRGLLPSVRTISDAIVERLKAA